MKIKELLKKIKPLLIVLHYLIAGLTFPVYLFCYVNIRIFESFFNMTVRAHFFDYVITRKDRWFGSLSVMILSVYMFFFFDYLELLVLNYDLGIVEEYYYMFLEYQNLIFMVVGIGFIYVLLDYIFIGKLIMGLGNSKLSNRKKKKYRKKAKKKDKVFVGVDQFTNDPIYINDNQRSLHILTAGTTGTGKSQSFIFPFSMSDLERGKGLITVDPKGDIEFFEKLYTYYHEDILGKKSIWYKLKHDLLGMEDELREKLENKDFKIVNLADPKNSHTYNPIFNGNAIEIKDRIMSSFEWSEEFYRTRAESILITLLQGIENAGKKVTFHDLYKLLTNRQMVQDLAKRCEDDFYKEQLQDKIVGEDMEHFDLVKEQCSGLINNIDLIAHSSMSKIVNTYNPDVNLLEVYKNDEIVFFSLPSQQLGQTARAFGKMLLMDLKSTSGYIEQKGANKHFFPVFIDEFAEFATPEFVNWLNKARSSGFAIHIAFQSLGDLEQVNDAFVKQVIDNTNLKMIFRVNDSDTAESFAGQLGTQTVRKETERVEKTFLTEKEGMMGSVREVEEFKVHTNTIKSFKMGEGLLFTKHPEKIESLVTFDYYPDKDHYKSLYISSKPLIHNEFGNVLDSALLLDEKFYYDTLGVADFQVSYSWAVDPLSCTLLYANYSLYEDSLMTKQVYFVEDNFALELYDHSFIDDSSLVTDCYFVESNFAFDLYDLTKLELDIDVFMDIIFVEDDFDFSKDNEEDLLLVADNINLDEEDFKKYSDGEDEFEFDVGEVNF